MRTINKLRRKSDRLLGKPEDGKHCELLRLTEENKGLRKQNDELRKDNERLKGAERLYHQLMDSTIAQVEYLRTEGITEAILLNPTFQKARKAWQAQTVQLMQGRSKGMQ